MKRQRVVLSSVAVGLVVVILIALLGVFSATKKLDLVNFDQMESGMTVSQVGQLENYLWESLQRTQGFDDEKREIVALVRPSSFTRTEKDGIVSYDFLVDVDEFRATYEVSFALMRGKGFYEAPVVDCPAASLMKYAGVECVGEKTSGLSASLGQFLPDYFYLESGELVTVTMAGGEALSARVGACGNETIVSKTTEAVRRWAAGLGYELSAEQIKVEKFCDGGY